MADVRTASSSEIYRLGVARRGYARGRLVAKLNKMIDGDFDNPIHANLVRQAKRVAANELTDQDRRDMQPYYDELTRRYGPLPS